MGLSIKTCYTVKIQKQLDVTQDKTNRKTEHRQGTCSRQPTDTSDFSDLSGSVKVLCLRDLGRMGYDHECGVKAEKTSDRYVSAPNKNGCSEVSGV